MTIMFILQHFIFNTFLMMMRVKANSSSCHFLNIVILQRFPVPVHLFRNVSVSHNFHFTSAINDGEDDCNYEEKEKETTKENN